MSTLPETILPRATADEFGRLAECWGHLGLWCTLWSGDGQLLADIPQSPPLWKSLWVRGQALRHELSQCVRGRREHHGSLLNIAGLCLQCTSVPQAPRHPMVAVACYLDDTAAWTEELSRLCSQWQLDERLMRSWFCQQPRLTDVQVRHAGALLQQAVLDIHQRSTHRAETDEMTRQLAEAYEELNLIYRIGATMRVTQMPREHFSRLFADLARTTPFTTMAAVLYDTDVLDADNRLIIGGEPIVEAPQVLRIAHVLQPLIEHHSNAMVINSLQQHPDLHWAEAWLERLLAVPIVSNQSLLGLVLVFNHSNNGDFNSTDARLLHSVVDRSAIYLENVLLYGDLNNLLMGLLHALVSSIDAKDPYTSGHSNRVAVVAQKIAEKTGADPEAVKRVYLSGLLHDVGKIGISELILCKPGRLSDSEMLEMQKHPEIGAKILTGIKQLDDIIPGVLHHHEWISGQGYPAGLAGDAVPWIARVVGLADAFDAMTSGRNYRNALPLSSALAELRRFAGTQFCPRLVDALIELVDEGLLNDLKNVKVASVFDRVQTRWIRPESLHEH